MDTIPVDTSSVLRTELHRARQALEAVTEAVLMTDLGGLLQWSNPAAAALLGHDPEPILGHDLRHLLVLLDNEQERLSFDPCLLKGETVFLVEGTTLIRSDGSGRQVEGLAAPLRPPAMGLVPAPKAGGKRVVGIEEGDGDGMVLILRDTSDRQRLAREARYDALTGLLNREGFEQHSGDALERARERAEREEGPEESSNDAGHFVRGDVLFYLDLDQFQVVNETCGHAAGDMLVQWIASLIRERLGDADVLARLGGDEFALLIRDTTIEGAERLAGEIHASLAHFRFVWQDKSFSIGTSIGLVPVTADFDDLAALAGAADRACFLAKRHGRGQTQIYEPDDAEVRRHQGQMNWVVRLQQALDENLFELHWQRIAPVRPLVSDGPLFFEVLVRLRAPDGSLHLPGEFLPAAEHFDLMPAIDSWIVRRLLDLLRRQDKTFLDALDGVTINLSGASIGDRRVLELIHQELDRTAFPAQKLCFEITETAAVSNLQRAVEMIEQLKRRRCRWALDDFGSGMSSFRYLQELPVDFVKIDGDIVADIPNSRLSRAMVEAIHQLAHVMDARTIAERVEDATLLAVLREIGLDMAQGFHIARPRPIREREQIADHLPTDPGRWDSEP